MPEVELLSRSLHSTGFQIVYKGDYEKKALKRGECFSFARFCLNCFQKMDLSIQLGITMFCFMNSYKSISEV